jgi:hypothetical protein
MERQIRTLPEGLGDREVLLQRLYGDYVPLPHGKEVWIIHSRQSPGMCFGVHHNFVAMSTDAPTGPLGPGDTVLVYRARLLSIEERRKKAPDADADAFRHKLERWRDATKPRKVK